MARSSGAAGERGGAGGPGAGGDGEPMTADAVRAALDALGDPEDAAFLQRFFKTGPGEYGEGDVFIGVRVPVVRRVARRFAELPPAELERLLDSPVHEHRLTALVIEVERFRRSRAAAERAALHLAYLDAVRRGRVDNWDLVDASAEYLVGEQLVALDAGTGLLDALAGGTLWERRVAVLATFAFIKHGDAGPTLRLAERLLGDPEPLMHKAVGWMLREVGKRVDRAELLAFLDAHAGAMPRTMLSYATEHLAPEQRAAYRAVPRTG